MNCPSCGFEAKDGAAWCDLCKHPFRKARPPRPEPAPPPAQRPAPAAPDPRLAELLKELPPEVRARIPPELQSSGEPRLPKVSSNVRALAWGFLGFWFVLGMIVMGLAWGRHKVLERERAEAPESFALPPR